jgi:hypothetical protein
MIHIVCFKWGTKFTAEYVNKLYRAIQRNVTVPYTFTCFTEDPTGIECETEPFIMNLPTWWYIIGLFNKDHGFKDKVLYIDLDTVITDNIDHILELDTDFAIIRDFYRPQGLQTAFIMWKPEWGYYIWDNLIKDMPKDLTRYGGGTNKFIEINVKDKPVTIFQDEFPGEFISYKVHIEKKTKRYDSPGDLSTSKLICFHGQPRPCEPKIRKLEWIQKHWI